MAKEKIRFWDVLISCGSLRIKAIKILDHILGTFILFFLPSSKPVEASTVDIRKVLIVRPGGIGDAVHLLALMRELKETFPQLQADILCEKRNHGVFESQPGLFDRIYCYDRLKDLFEVSGRRYDAIIDTEQWHYFSGLLGLKINSRIRAGFITRPLRAKLYNQKAGYKINAYEMDNFKDLFNLVFRAQFKTENIDNSYRVADDLQKWAKGQIPGRSVALFSGGSIPPRRLTGSQVKDLIVWIIRQGFCAVLLGGKDQAALKRELKVEIRDDRFLNLIGETSLKESAALMEQSALFIGTDSGLLHLACAVGTPVVGVFGPGNFKKWGPKGNRHTVVKENVSCSPCTQFGYTVPTCHGSYHCMSGIQWPLLCSAIEQQLSIKR